MTAPAILFIHGFPFDHTMWRHQVAALSDWRPIAPDLRGIGDSPGVIPAHGYSMSLYADDLIRMLDALEVRQVVACGLSMGGYIVFELLRRYPDRVRAAVLCNTKATPDSADAKRARDEMAVVADRSGAAAVAKQLLPKLLSPATVATQPRVVAEVRAMMERCPVPGILGALRALRDRPDSTPMLGSIRVPVLVVAGADDQIVPATLMREMAGAIPGARFVLIADAGHVTPLEQPQAFNAAIDEFL